MYTNICMYVYVCMNKCVFCVYTGIYFLALSLERAKNPNNPVAMSTCSDQILASNTIFHWEEPELFREMLNLREGQSRYKMNLEYFVMPGSVSTALKNGWGLSQGLSNQLERIPNG